MSETYIALLVNFIVFVAPHFGLSVVDPSSLAGSVAAVVGLVATGWAFYGRYKAGGITIFGLRKA